jgi:hypothetical protein
LEVRGNPIGPVNGEFHGLKIQILDGKTAIAFATSNATATALCVINEAQQEIQKNPNVDVFDHVFQNYKRRLNACSGEKPDCEFLVLKLETDGKRLASITGTELKFAERAYIGDPNQYAKMTELRKPHQGPKEQHVQQSDGSFKVEEVRDSKGTIEFTEIGFAMEALVQQRRKEGVGAIAGNVIRVVDARVSGELEYLQQHEAGIAREEGQVGFSLLASNSGVRGLGIYYIAGKMGYVLIAGDKEMCRRETAASMESFVKIANQKYGLELV